MKSLISITSVNIIVTRVTLQCPMYYMHEVMQLIVHQHLFVKPRDSTWPTCRDIYRDNCIINVVVDLCCCCSMYIIQKGFKLGLPNLALWCGYDIGFKRSKVKIMWSENQWAWVSWSFSSADCSTVAVLLMSTPGYWVWSYKSSEQWSLASSPAVGISAFSVAKWETWWCCISSSNFTSRGLSAAYCQFSICHSLWPFSA